MQGPNTRAPCEQPPPQSIRSAHLFRFLCALCPRALESPSQPFRAAIDLSGALLWLTHPRPSSRRDSAVTSFLSPQWHGDQVPLEPGSVSARPPERIPVLGVSVSLTPIRYTPSPEVPEFPSCVNPLSPHLQSSSRQSGPRSLTTRPRGSRRHSY